MAETVTYAPAAERGVRFPRWGWFVVVIVAVVLLLTVLPLQGLWVRTSCLDLNSGDHQLIVKVLGFTVRNRVTQTTFSRAVRQYSTGSLSPRWVAFDVRGYLLPIEDSDNGRVAAALHQAELALELVAPAEPLRQQFVSDEMKLLSARQYTAMNRLTLDLMRTTSPDTQPTN